MTSVDTPSPTPRFRWRLRLGAWCMGLVAIAFIQAPGRIATDTKLDLAVDPIGFLGRALTLWDPNGAFGQVQNQAYGYLFPMGPFFVLGHVLDLPPWVTQRLWWALILVVAFLGVVKLCGVLGIGAPWVRVAAALAFALSPRFLSVMGPSSIEVWPSAVAPWVLVPLVIGLRRGDPRKMAVLSAVAVACVGGVNAAATFAVIPLGALWLLTAPAGPRRRSLMTWWPAFVALGTLWWLGPLLLLGRYSPAFLDYIESASNATFAATAFDALRGVSDWVPYVDVNAAAGRDLVSDPLLIANLTVLLCLGLIGLTRRDLPHRRFLVGGLLTGMAIVTLGHLGSPLGLGAETLHTLLDGVLAPLRNTHKFDVLIRLPLVIGLCHAVTVLVRPRLSADGTRRRIDPAGLGTASLMIAALVGSTVPAWNAAIANRASFVEVPPYWSQAASWLERHADGTTLLTPATPFGDYLWGKSNDEPLQALASTPWAVRNLIPLAPGGNIEALDTISNQFATGTGGAGFADYLRRAGISTFIVRNDVSRQQDIVPPDLVRAALLDTPGVSKVAEFGPEVGGGPTLSDPSGREVFVDRGWQTSRPALEVFQLDGVDRDWARQTVDETPVVIGDSDSLLALDQTDGLSGRSVLMAQDANPDVRPAETVLTDGHRRQEVAFGAVNHQRSGALTTDEPWSQDRRVHRYDEDRVERWTTTPRLMGARSIRSSSSAADVGAVPHIDQSAQTWAAFDGDAGTSWRPDARMDGRTSWVEVDLGRRVDVGTARISLGLKAGETRTLSVTTEQGPRTVRVGERPETIDVGRVSRVRVSGLSTAASPLVVDDVTLEKVPLSRPLELPDVPAAWGTPARILMQAGPRYDEGCLTFDEVPRCSPKYFSRGDDGRTLDRMLSLPAATDYDTTLRVAPIGGPELTALLQRDRLVSVAASSQLTDAAGAGAVAAIDGQARTGWIASPDDVGPTMTLNWVGERRVSSLRLSTSASLAATTPTQVTLTFSDGSTVDGPVEDGLVTFPAVVTDSVKVQLGGGAPVYSVDFDGSLTKLPLGVSEIGVPGVRGTPLSTDVTPREYPCGTGPVVAVNGTSRRTAVVASPSELIAGAAVDARLCGGTSTRLEAGSNRVTVAGNGAFRPVDLTLVGTDAASGASGSGGTLLTTGHNSNTGWAATDGSESLRSVVVNGWQQGYVDADGDRGATVTESFTPGSIYRSSLFVGALALLVLALLACVPASATRSALPTGGRARRGGRWWLLGGGLLVAGLVAGPLGLVAAAVGVTVPRLGRRHLEVAAGTAVAVSVGVAGVFYVLGPWAGFDQWAGERATPQLLVVAALGVLVSGAGPGGARRASFRRRKGRSTSR